MSSLPAAADLAARHCAMKEVTRGSINAFEIDAGTRGRTGPGERYGPEAGAGLGTRAYPQAEC